MATRSSRCKTCGTRTTASAGFCQRCKSLRHHGYKRVKAEKLVVDEAGGAWWVWSPRGDVIVTGKPSREAAILALGGGEDDVEDETCDETCDHSDHHATSRYLRITLVDGTRFILRVTNESSRFVHGYEVDAEGDEVVPPGYQNRLRAVERALVAKTVEMRMNNKYAALEVVPAGERAKKLDAEIAEALGQRRSP